MVTLDQVIASNVRIATTLPSGMVAVFVGSTSGIGEFTMKVFARRAKSPKIYFIGRSQTAADRITSELKELNSEGEYVFIQADVSLIKNVDVVCEKIKSKETAINLLFQSQGTLVTDGKYAQPLNESSCRLTAGPTQTQRRAFPPWSRCPTFRGSASLSTYCPSCKERPILSEPCPYSQATQRGPS